MIFEFAKIAGAFLTVCGTLMLAVAVAVIAIMALYRRVTTGRWGRTEPSLTNRGERKAFYEKSLADYKKADEISGKGEWFFYLAIPFNALYWLHAPHNDNTPKIFFAVSFVNAAVVWLLQKMKQENQEGLRDKLRGILEAEKEEREAPQRAERERKAAEEARRRADRQAQKDREYAERKEREQARKRTEEEQARREERQRRSEGESPRSKNSAHQPWHKVLDVSPNASIDEIKKAYFALIKQYHPDKVHELGAELKELANLKSAEINRAYQEALESR